MALVVEDGTGMANADSYVSLADAESYFAAMPPSVTTAWTSLATDAEKENLLRYATRVLDQKARFKGARTVKTSSLRWPRTGAIDCDGVLVGSNVLPRPIVSAVCEIALWCAAPGQGPNTVSSKQGIESITADVVSVTFRADYDATSVQALPRGLNQILLCLGTIQYGSRSSFGPISKA